VSEPPAVESPIAPLYEEYSYKIAIYTDILTDEPESISMLNAEKQYQHQVFLKFASHDPDPYAMPKREALINEALQFLEDPKINALIFVSAGNIDEPAGFLKTLRESRPDIFCIAVDGYPWSDAYGIDDNLMGFADLELSIDQAVTAKKAVEQAKKMGAVACIDYTFRNHGYYDIDLELYMESRILPAVRDAIKAECIKQDIKYVEELGPDRMSDIGMEKSAQWPIEAIDDNIAAYGQNICFFSSQCHCSTLLLGYQFVLNTKGIIVQLCHPSLFHKGWKNAAGFDMLNNIDHFGDLEWTFEQTKSKLEKEGLFGRFATWRVPFTMAATTAAVEYAIGYCEGEIESKTDLDAMRQCFQKAMEIYDSADTGFELNQHPDYPNCFLFTEDYIVL
jgi:hypothetical protein